MRAYEMIIAGFGGQGILFMGQVLAHAANEIGKNVSWLPSYGPEMRGGTANCMVCLSDEEINSPLVLKPNVLVAMNKPSMQRFQTQLTSGGWLVVNEDMVDIEPERKDIKVVKVKADTIAAELKNEKTANMVALGTLIGFTGVISLEDTIKGFHEMVPPERKNIIPINEAALKKGFEIGNNARQEG
jgi:2-oxoglutarate ferredoxin oxidoreductase subunit gamma